MKAMLFENSFGGLHDLEVMFYVSIVGLEILFGVICRSIMKNKSYSSYNFWFIFGFLFSFIGVIICALMSNVKPQEQPNDLFYPDAQRDMQLYRQYSQPIQQPSILNENNAVTCPHCLELTPKESLFCIKCGCKLD